MGRSLDRKLYELIYIRVSLINGCRYCLQHHVASSKRVGLTAENWAALKAGDYHATPTKKELRWSTWRNSLETLTKSPMPILRELKKHSEHAEIVDIHLLTGLANLTNRFTDPLGLELEMPEEKI